MKGGGVLDYGKAEACAAGLAAVALVDPVEPLEYAALLVVGDADAVVADLYKGASLAVAAGVNP